MRIIDISKIKFDEIKPCIKEWLHKMVLEDPDTIFHFLSDLTEEDRKFLHQNADNFIINKKQIIKIETIKNTGIWSWMDQVDNAELDDNSDEYEVYMKVGRKYYSKLQKYPIQTLGIINIMNSKMDFLTEVCKYSFFINVATLIYVFSR